MLLGLARLQFAEINPWSRPCVNILECVGILCRREGDLFERVYPKGRRVG